MHQDDTSIVAGIQGTAEARDAALSSFFRQHRALRAQVVAYVANSGGTAQDGEDVFQDTVVLFDRSIRKGQFEHKSSLKTFFFSIAKFHWIGKRRRQKTVEALAERRDNESMPGPEVHYIAEERKKILESAMQHIGAKCKQLLTLYALSYKMEEIAQVVGLSSGAMAKKGVYQCRMKLRAHLMQYPHLLLELGIDPELPAK